MLNVKDLKESNEFLNSLLDNINSAVFLVDENVKVRSFNNSFQTLFGKESDDILGKLCGNALGCVFAVREEKDCGSTIHCNKCYLRSNLLHALIEKVPAKREIMEREFYIGGSYVNKILQYSTKYINYDSMKMILVIVEDVTEIEGRKREVEQKNIELKAANQKIKEEQERRIEVEKKNAVLSLGVTANHELNQPLAVANANLGLFIKTINDIDLTEKQMGLLDKVSGSVEKMTGIIKRYVDKSKEFRFDKYANDLDMVIFNDEDE